MKISKKNIESFDKTNDINVSVFIANLEKCTTPEQIDFHNQLQILTKKFKDRKDSEQKQIQNTQGSWHQGEKKSRKNKKRKIRKTRCNKRKYKSRK